MEDLPAPSPSGNRSAVRQAFADCPLIEIVHFHDCLRGELRSLRANVDILCGQMRALPVPSPPTLTPPSPPTRPPAVVASSVSNAQGEEKSAAAAGDGGINASVAAIPPCPPAESGAGTVGTAAEAAVSVDGWVSTEAGAAVVALLPREHVELEVQIQSQFQLLWAVFQSHSTAEDEMIWPALKEKARSSGGKLKLVNHDDDDDDGLKTGPFVPQPNETSPRNNATSPAGPPIQAADADDGTGAAPVENEGMSVDPVVTAAAGAAGSGNGSVSGSGSGVEEDGEFGGAMIDEQEYAEEHSQEQRLFEGMQEVLTRLRNTRQSLPERLRVIAGLGSKTDEICRHLMTHLDKEEESALPLIKHYFTSQEMGALVGKIMGKRPTELMQTILAMVIKNLPPDEVWTVMGYMRHAVKDTYFEKWLAAGGFQWPTRKDEDACSDDGIGDRSTAGDEGVSPIPGTLSRVRNGTNGDHGIVGVNNHRRPCTTSACGTPHQYDRQQQHNASPSAATEASLSVPLALTSSSRRLNKRLEPPLRGGSGEGQPGAAGDCGATGACPLDREFEGMNLNGADDVPIRAGVVVEKSLVGAEEDLDAAGIIAPAEGSGETTCRVCSYIGRCPVSEPLSQAEFEVVVKRLSHVTELSTERKNGLVQTMRNHMYQGRKRPRLAGGNEAVSGAINPGSTARTIWSTGPNPPGGKDLLSAAAAGGGGGELAAPARYYTSTQPDIEDAGGGVHGWVAGRGGEAIPPPLFTKEDLSPTYHLRGAVSASPTGGKAAASAAVACETADGGGGVGNGTGGASDPDGSVGGAGSGAFVLGCPHYRRACKMRAPCCQRLFTCRLCHDQASDHTVDRQEVKEMLCMRCGTLQPMHSECRNPSCRPNDAEGPTADGKRMARYYCGICHLFDDAPGKDIYHCPYCNVCRVGKGLGVDFFHCMTCNACISSGESAHTCLSKSLESDCPICGSSVFTSTSQVKGLKCGHFMHLRCYKEYIRRAESREFWYRCPVCRKSMEDMHEYFYQMDAVVASQPMPEQYSGWKTKVLCHDCERYTEVPYHFLYNKCGACGSYNTRTEGQTTREGVRTASGIPLRTTQGEDDRSAPPGP